MDTVPKYARNIHVHRFYPNFMACLDKTKCFVYIMCNAYKDMCAQKHKHLKGGTQKFKWLANNSQMGNQ